MMVFYAGLMFYYNVALTLIGMMFAGISFCAARARPAPERTWCRPPVWGRSRVTRSPRSSRWRRSETSGQESAFFTKWAGRYAKSLNTMMELEIASQAITVLPLLFRTVNTAAIYLIGGIAVIDGSMSIGTLVAFTALMSNFQDPVKDLVELGSSLQELDGGLSASTTCSRRRSIPKRSTACRSPGSCGRSSSRVT